VSQSQSRPTDLELVRRVQEVGDQRAFELLVVRYQRKLLNLAGRYARSEGEAEDIVQEAFIRAWRSIAGFRGESAFYTWLYRITINAANNYLAAASRRPISDAVEIAEGEQLICHPRLIDHASPESEALTDEIGATLGEVVDKLPEELRTAILLREIEGMSYEEIAQAMECPIGTVRSRIFRAREAIERALQPLLG
jgi:RNA polymerase sigma-70 factor (ECF subfamily)